MPLGTGVQLAVVDEARVEDAMAVVIDWLARLDLAASRFRSDSEISRLNAAAGAPTQVSPLLARVIAVALDVAAITDGIVDPTVGSAMDTIGYDRDFDEVMRGDARTALSDPVPAPGWRSVHLDRDHGERDRPHLRRRERGQHCGDRARRWRRRLAAPARHPQQA